MKRCLLFFLTMLFSYIMLSCTVVAYATEINGNESEEFKLILCADDSLKESQNKVDLSGIKVDVYKSELTDFVTESNLSKFTHSYAFSVYTDVNGKTQFVRPSDEMLILIDVSTLPRNTGIAVSTKFYRSDIKQDSLDISKVDKVVIDKIDTSEDDFYVSAYNKDGTRINVESSLSEISSEISENRKLVCLKACVGDITETYEYMDTFNSEIGLETQHVECVEELLNQGREDAVSELKPADFDQKKRFGHFLICYNWSSDITPPFITALASALQSADTSLVGGLGFNRPKSNTQGTDVYHIFVIDYEILDAAAFCQSMAQGSGTSYIVFQNITDLSVEPTLYQKGTAAHEYMHAITHTYRNNGELPSWFKESWANWAAIRVQGIESRDYEQVNGFLNNIYKSFNTDEDSYGKCLLPLYISQNYGELSVANAIKNLANTSNPISAISNALPSGVTFQSIFPDFMGYNYAPKYFYTTHASRWSDRPHISASYTLNNYPNNAYGGVINSYAANYREFLVPATTPYNLDITINSLNNTDLMGKLHMSRSNGVTTNWSLSAEGALVTYSTTIGVSYVKGGISITNKGNGSTGFYITIARS